MDSLNCYICLSIINGIHVKYACDILHWFLRILHCIHWPLACSLVFFFFATPCLTKKKKQNDKQKKKYLPKETVYAQTKWKGKNAPERLVEWGKYNIAYEWIENIFLFSIFKPNATLATKKKINKKKKKSSSSCRRTLCVWVQFCFSFSFRLISDNEVGLPFHAVGVSSKLQ